MKSVITRYVLGFLFDPTCTSVTLIRKNRPDWQRGLYNGIGGHVEMNESPNDAIAREFEEETGVRIDAWEEFCVLTDSSTYVVHCYRVRSAKINGVSSTTDEEVIVCEISDLLEYPVISNLRWLIPMALDPNHKHSVSHA